ncbi:MAG TPA: dihydrofolate reductase family protein [Solirubrobacteraceae bacterium]|jgi:riboflavin-specific deaminase-like protein|nr:dihydrofolate reductase family protein [Solirubrobacteraceae bacterium]
MSPTDGPPAAASAHEPAPQFERLLPRGEHADATQIADELDLLARASAGAGTTRPYTILNMVSTVDGRASIGGRSGALGDRADRELFHALRASVDAVMAGAGTVRVERYGRIIPNADTRRRRVERGLSEEPMACIVSGRLSLAADTPLLNEPDARVVLITPSQSSLPETSAQIDYVRARRDGLLDLPAAMAELAERLGVRTLLCEGGPHLNGQLLLAGLVDELFLSFSPKLAGGEDATGEALRIVAGVEFAAPLSLQLLSVLESASTLFLRYGVRAAAPERA